MDAGCGSGTASLVALYLGMSTYAFDSDIQCVRGTQARLASWTTNGPDSDRYSQKELDAAEAKKNKRELKRAEREHENPHEGTGDRANAKRQADCSTGYGYGG